MLLTAASVDPRIVSLSDAFADLMENRHAADYDSLVTFSKADVLANVAAARRAIADLENCLGAPPADALMCLLVLRGS